MTTGFTSTGNILEGCITALTNTGNGNTKEKNTGVAMADGKTPRAGSVKPLFHFVKGVYSNAVTRRKRRSFHNFEKLVNFAII